MAKTIDLVVEFTFVPHSPRSSTESLLIRYSGGLEMLFSNKRKHKISIPVVEANGSPSTIAFLITWLCENLVDDPRKEMFVVDDSVYLPT